MIFWILIIASAIIPYFVVMGLIYRGWHRIPKTQRQSFEPTVSILVAARNEAHSIAFLLRDFQQLDYSKEKLEILIADDHSTDHTYALAKTFPGIKILRAEESQFSFSGKKEALRALAQIASGEILLFTDADCRVNPGWVKSMIAPFNQSYIHMVAGSVMLTGNPLMELEFMSLVISTAGSIGAGFPLMCNGASLALRRTTYLSLQKKIIGNHLASGDDVFMMLALIKQKKTSAIAWNPSPEGVVLTPAPHSLKKFFLQRIRWAGKSSHYNYGPTQWVALVVLFTNLVFALSLVPFIRGVPLPFISIFILKSIPDFILLWIATGFYRKRTLMWFFLPLQVLYPLYILITSAGILLVKPKWKGRPVS